MQHDCFDRQLLVKAMAADLRRLGATDSERSAIRALSAAPYRLGDVAALAEDALFEARQNAVTAEMARR